jgi:hypothetical protein
MLLDHFVRLCQHVGRNRQADLFGCFQIDDELELRRLFSRKVGRLSAFQNLIVIGGSKLRERQTYESRKCAVSVDFGD